MLAAATNSLIAEGSTVKIGMEQRKLAVVDQDLIVGVQRATTRRK
jgi:hypothetical protein